MVETDKLTETYAIRMNEAVLIAIARALHDARFNPDLYLKDA
jgi:hypothetical protein